MKRIPGLILAALVATTGSAFAKGATARDKGTTISLDTFCDILTIKHNVVLRSAITATDDPNCEPLFGAGFVGKVKVLGKSAIIGMHEAGSTEEFVFRIDYPFVTGGTWFLYGTSNGEDLIAAAGDTYTVGGTPARGSKPLLSTIKH